MWSGHPTCIVCACEKHSGRMKLKEYPRLRLPANLLYRKRQGIRSSPQISRGSFPCHPCSLGSAIYDALLQGSRSTFPFTRLREDSKNKTALGLSLGLGDAKPSVSATKASEKWKTLSWYSLNLSPGRTDRRSRKKYNKNTWLHWLEEEAPDNVNRDLGICGPLHMAARKFGLIFLGFSLAVLTVFYLRNDGNAPANEQFVLFQRNSTKTYTGETLHELCHLFCHLLTKYPCRRF